MRHTAHRLLRLIALLQARRQWSGAELAERMGVDRRSIRRDIERLRELGYPVQASSGVGGGYQLGAGAPVLPMLLDEEEATTLAIALRAASATVAGIDDTARGLLSKLDPLVPTRRRQQAGEVHAATATLSDLPSTDARLLGRLAQHCRQASRLAFEYRSAQDAVTQREVEAQHWSITGGAGTCWPGIWAGRTGAPCAWTGWARYASAPSRACIGARRRRRT